MPPEGAPVSKKKRVPKRLREVVWIDRGWQPVGICYCPGKEAFRRFKKRYRVKGHWKIDNMSGKCTRYENYKTGENIIMVSLNDEERNPAELIATIVHESVHVWQFLTRSIGENEPGDEMMAYGIQHIYMGLSEAFAKTNGKGRKWI